MHPTIHALLLAAAFATPVQSVPPDAPPPPSQLAPRIGKEARTGKEALSDKASDEQRVDDCKVRVDRRTRQRAADCPWEVGS